MGISNTKLNFITEFWLENNSALLTFIQSKISDKQAADDILQDVYVKLHVAVEKIKDLNKISSWVYQVTRNTINDYYRDSDRFVREKPDLNIEFVGLQLDESYKLNKVIDSLPEKYKTPLVLSDLKGMPQKEVAKQLDLTISATKSRIQRARVLLIEAMKEHCIFKTDKYGNIIECQDRKPEL